MEVDNVVSEAEDDFPATQIVDDRVLKDVVAYVEVRSTNDNRSEAVGRELTLLGATVVKKFTSDVTHVVFKEGTNRTKTKAQKKGIYLVSVLWVENCKQNQEHVSERMYPAVVPRLKGTPLLMTKLKKAKSMQPRDFEEELASSAERVRRKRKRLDAINRLKSLETTPSSSPRPTVLVQDTQPRSPDDYFVFTPIRLTIPDTPPSMREKMRKIREAKEGALGSNSASELHDDTEEKHVHLKQLQKKLFKSRASSCDNMSPTMSTDTSSVFMTDCENEGTADEEEMTRHKTDHKAERALDQNVSVTSDASVNDDIFKIARNLNLTLNSQVDKDGSGPGLFGEDSDENLLNSQEITTVVNAPVMLKQHTNNDVGTDKEFTDNHVVNCFEGKNNVKKASPKRKSGVQAEAAVQDKKQRRRSSRRLSVQQAIQELDTSNVLDVLPENDEDENPIPDLSVSNDNSSHENKQDNDNLTNKKEKAKREGRNSKGKSRETKQGGNKGRRSNVSLDNSKTSSENETNVKSVSENNTVEDEERKAASSKATKGKKTMKKKLMSLTDLMEQHSVLIEPTKCSQVERPQLEPTKAKKGRKRKGTSADNSSDSVEIRTDANKDISDTDGNVRNEIENKNKSKNAKTANNSRKRKTNKESSEDTKCSAGRKKRSSVCGGENKIKRGKNTLVNETHLENDISKTHKDSTNHSPVAKIQDVTTQLNLTKDNGLVCSIRETTLSLSMSTAYTDANMPSFLSSQRKSIDEFNPSQKRQNKKQNLKERSVLASINEKTNNGNLSSSDSDRSVNSGKRRGKISHSQHRKIVRPSIVMTSLHSYEQDVVISVVKKLGGFVIAENVNETTTHVICGETRRTLNVLHGLARGIWLLTKEWVIKSLEAGKWILEAEFECTSSFPACKRARIEQEKNPGLYRQSLFNRIGPVYISGRSQPPRQHLVQLLKLCGGQVIGIRENASIYLGSDYHPGMTCVKTNWLLDCITSQQLLPMDRYYLDRPKRESSPAY